MSSLGEQLLIVATVEPVEADEILEALPLHMPVSRWFSFPDTQKQRLFNAMSNIFDEQELFQEATTGKVLKPLLLEGATAREILVDRGPWFGFQALIRSLGSLPDGSAYDDEFAPYIVPSVNEVIRQKQQFDFTTAALISRIHQGAPLRVLTAHNLSPKKDMRG
jgi:hypothetical protein